METKDLNLIPSGDKPIVHASQFDDMRLIRFNLFDNDEEYTLESGISLECHIKKVDGNIVTFSVENTEAKYIDVYLPQQATTCAGPNIGEIVLMYMGEVEGDEYLIGTINFILEVEKSPMLGGIESESAIHDLTEQIEIITAQIIGNDYYNKTEVDNLLDQKADISDIPDMDNYYDKSETNSLLAGKANYTDLPDMSLYYNKLETNSLLNNKADKSDTYTKTQVDNALALKADISDLPDMSNYYTKTEINNKFIDIMPINTSTGSIANFTTSLALPLADGKFGIVAQQESGTPSPSSPKAISGYTGMNIVNLSDTDKASAFKGLFDGTYGFVDMGDLSWSTGTAGSVPVYVVYNFNEAKAPSTNAQKPNMFSPIYETVSRNNLTDTNEKITLSNASILMVATNETYADADAFKTAMSGVYLIYELATPTTPTITAQQFATLCTAFGITGNLYPITFGSAGTVYGGYVDLKNGKLRVTNGFAELNGSENWGTQSGNSFYVFISGTKSGLRQDGLCNYLSKAQTIGSDFGFVMGYNNSAFYASAIIGNIEGVTNLASWKTYLSNNHLKVVYPLANPIEYDLTVPEIVTLIGTNNIWCDTNGDSEVSFKQTIQEYIDDKLGE